MSLLEELAEVAPRTAAPRPAPDVLVPVVMLADVDSASATVTPRLVPFGEAPSSVRAALPGDVLLARIAPAMQEGKLGIVPAVEHPVCFVSSELIVLRPRDGMPAEWLRAFLRQERVRERLALRLTGSSGRQRLSPRVVRVLELPHPPTAEALERVLAVQRTIDELDATRERALLRLSELPSLLVRNAATSWPRRSLDVFKVEYGYGVGARGSVAASGRPLLRPINVRGGELELGELLYVPPGSGRGESQVLSRGDLLVVRASTTRERLGAAAVYRGMPASALFSSQLVRVRLAGAELLPELLCAWMRTDEARRYLSRAARLTDDHYALSLRGLKGLPVPDLPQDVQRRLEAAATAVAALLETGAAERTVLHRLRQATLGQAFRLGGDVAAERLRSPPAEAALGEIFKRLGARQQRIWRLVAERQDRFTLDDVLSPDGDRERDRRGLRVLERLGVVMTEREREAVSFRRYDPELDAAEDAVSVAEA